MKHGQIASIIKSWRNSHHGVVVAVDGYSGVGKTTLVKKLARKYTWITLLHLDDFCGSKNKRKETATRLAKCGPKAMPPPLWSPKDGPRKFRDAVRSWKKNTRGGYILLVDGVFLLHPVFDRLWDRRIYVDTNIREADRRRKRREKKRWGKTYLPETHPDSFVGGFVLLHRRYRSIYRPSLHTDFVLK